MNIFIKIIKKLGYSVLFFIGFLFIFWIATLILSRISVNKNTPPSNEVTIFVLSNGMHTDIVMPVQNDIFNWNEIINPQDIKSENKDYKFIALGWGDKKFYIDTPTWNDLTFSTAFQAVTGLGSSLMHATYYNSLTTNENCIALHISKENYKKLTENIIKSFVLENGKAINFPTEAVYGENDAFYKANGRYNLFFTCNSWTNKKLKNSNLRACVWTPFAFDVMRNLR
ncbi:MAG: TIGR02117 family protein [Capnocytophaga sp.]|nr:TIGR02117 family protein [Capnocytophaga sp.]